MLLRRPINEQKIVLFLTRLFVHVKKLLVSDLITDVLHDRLQNVAASRLVKHHRGHVVSYCFRNTTVLCCVILHAYEQAQTHPSLL